MPSRGYFLILLLLLAINFACSSDLNELFDPDFYLTAPEIIERHGYPAEVHTVETRDGYLLQLHRIPYGNKTEKGNAVGRTPVLIFHGLYSSSHDWIINGPEKSLSYRLADEGYDVWLANMRGNYYSDGHVEYTKDEDRFWDFSIDEMGIYDLPANVDYILHATNYTRLILISHSIGTTVFYIMASTFPEYATKIKFQISFSAISSIPHAIHLPGLGELLLPLEMFLTSLSHGGYQTTIISRLLYRILCNPYTSFICTYFILFPSYGIDFHEYDQNLTALYYAHAPAGTSVKTAIHAAQLDNPDGTFNYDYGEAGNLEHYGTPTPPQYNLNNIKVPIRIYYGDHDFVSTPIDSKSLYQKLPVPLGLIRVNCETFAHFDFFASKHINQLLNDDVIYFINNATNPITGDDFVFTYVQRSMNARSNWNVTTNFNTTKTNKN